MGVIFKIIFKKLHKKHGPDFFRVTRYMYKVVKNTKNKKKFCPSGANLRSKYLIHLQSMKTYPHLFLFDIFKKPFQFVKE